MDNQNTVVEKTFQSGQQTVDQSVNVEAKQNELNSRIAQMRDKVRGMSPDELLKDARKPLEERRPQSEGKKIEKKSDESDISKESKLDKKVEQKGLKDESIEEPESFEDLVGKSANKENSKEEDTVAKEDTRKQKADERLDKTWTSVNEWKTRLAQRELKLQKEVESKLAEKMKEFEESRPDIVRLKPDNYEELAKQAEENGNDELAESYRKQGKNVAKKLEEYSEKQKEYQAKLKDYKQALWYQIREDYPDVKNPNSELAQEIVAMYSDEKTAKIIAANPEMELLAVRHADYKVKAGKFDELKAEADELRSKVKDLEEKLSLSGAYEMKSNAGTKENLSSLPIDQRIKKLRGNAHAIFQ